MKTFLKKALSAALSTAMLVGAPGAGIQEAAATVVRVSYAAPTTGASASAAGVQAGKAASLGTINAATHNFLMTSMTPMPSAFFGGAPSERTVAPVGPTDSAAAAAGVVSVKAGQDVGAVQTSKTDAGAKPADAVKARVALPGSSRTALKVIGAGDVAARSTAYLSGDRSVWTAEDGATVRGSAFSTRDAGPLAKSRARTGPSNKGFVRGLGVASTSLFSVGRTLSLAVQSLATAAGSFLGPRNTMPVLSAGGRMRKAARVGRTDLGTIIKTTLGTLVLGFMLAAVGCGGGGGTTFSGPGGGGVSSGGAAPPANAPRLTNEQLAVKVQEHAGSQAQSPNQNVTMHIAVDGGVAVLPIGNFIPQTPAGNAYQGMRINSNSGQQLTVYYVDDNAVVRNPDGSVTVDASVIDSYKLSPDQGVNGENYYYVPNTTQKAYLVVVADKAGDFNVHMIEPFFPLTPAVAADDLQRAILLPLMQYFPNGYSETRNIGPTTINDDGNVDVNRDVPYIYQPSDGVPGSLRASTYGNSNSWLTTTFMDMNTYPLATTYSGRVLVDGYNSVGYVVHDGAGGSGQVSTQFDFSPLVEGSVPIQGYLVQPGDYIEESIPVGTPNGGYGDVAAFLARIPSTLNVRVEIRGPAYVSRDVGYGGAIDDLYGLAITNARGGVYTMRITVLDNQDIYESGGVAYYNPAYVVGEFATSNRDEVMRAAPNQASAPTGAGATSNKAAVAHQKSNRLHERPVLFVGKDGNLVRSGHVSRTQHGAVPQKQ